MGRAAFHVLGPTVLQLGKAEPGRAIAAWIKAGKEQSIVGIRDELIGPGAAPVLRALDHRPGGRHLGLPHGGGASTSMIAACFRPII